MEVRVGVDTDRDGQIVQWTDWSKLKESYDYTPGFAKQIQRTPARMDLEDPPKGYGFQFELRTNQTTDNGVLPLLDEVTFCFE